MSYDYVVCAVAIKNSHSLAFLLKLGCGEVNMELFTELLRTLYHLNSYLPHLSSGNGEEGCLEKQSTLHVSQSAFTFLCQHGANEVQAAVFLIN